MSLGVSICQIMANANKIAHAGINDGSEFNIEEYLKLNKRYL